MQVFLGADHAGYELKELIRQFLEAEGHQVTDLGTHSPDSVDYPDYAHAVAERVATATEHPAYGVLVCGSGQGMSMAANKHEAIRAALVWAPELARLARAHNNANIICLPARFITPEVAKACVWQFLHEPFEGGRHQRRVEKVASQLTLR